MGADRLEHLLNRDLAAVDDARHDGPAVVNQARDIHPRQRHGRSRNGLVAADDADHAVQLVALDRQLDGVGHNLARDQRGLHSGRAHGDAVGHDDGVEVHRIAAGGRDPGAHVPGQPVQVHVARRDRRPGVDDADHRLVEVGVLHTRGPQIGPRGRPAGAMRNRRAARVRPRRLRGRILRHRSGSSANRQARKTPLPFGSGVGAGRSCGLGSGRVHPRRLRKQAEKYERNE